MRRPFILDDDNKRSSKFVGLNCGHALTNNCGYIAGLPRKYQGLNRENRNVRRYRPSSDTTQVLETSNSQA